MAINSAVSIQAAGALHSGLGPSQQPCKRSVGFWLDRLTEVQVEAGLCAALLSMLFGVPSHRDQVGFARQGKVLDALGDGVPI